jgi:metal-responsive CopG/Arc/MetJ family transcriptional regulator
MTVQLPQDLAAQFAQRIPARDRSRYLADALREKLSRDQILIEACQVANKNPEVHRIEKEFTW